MLLEKPEFGLYAVAVVTTVDTIVGHLPSNISTIRPGQYHGIAIIPYCYSTRQRDIVRFGAITKQNTTAKVWKHFGLQVDENGKASNVDNPVCRLCYTPVSEKNSNTSDIIIFASKT